MEVRYPAVAVMNIVNEILTNQLVFAREIGTAAKVDVEHFDVYQKVEEQLNAIKKKIENNGLSTNYANQLAVALDKLKFAFQLVTQVRIKRGFQSGLRPMKKERFSKDSKKVERQ